MPSCVTQPARDSAPTLEAEPNRNDRRSRSPDRGPSTAALSLEPVPAFPAFTITTSYLPMPRWLTSGFGQANPAASATRLWPTSIETGLQHHGDDGGGLCLGLQAPTQSRTGVSDPRNLRRRAFPSAQRLGWI